MAESRKETASSAGPKEKKSSFDDDIGNEFLGSWKSLSVAEDAMDFNFDTVSTGKKKPFNFDKLDMDFNLDGEFNKLTSFKVDMPDLDFSSPSKKTAKPKESSKGESSSGTHQGKRERFNFSFDFNDTLDFDLDSTLTEGKKISANSDIKDDGAVGIERQGSKLNMAGSNEAFDVCQTDNLPASDHATASTMETGADGAPGTRDASNDKFSSKTENIGEPVSTNDAQTSPQKTLSVSPKDAFQQIYSVEMAKSTEPVALDTRQVLPAQYFDRDDSTQATESDTEADHPAPKVNTDSVEEQNVADRKIDLSGSDHDNLQLNNSDPPHKNESGSNRVVSEKADSESPGENVIGTAQVQDDLDGEVTSAGTLSQTRSHSDAIKEIQKPTSILLAPLRSEHVAERVIPIKENEQEVGSSKILQRSNVTEPQLCQPSFVSVQVSSAVNKGSVNSYPANEKRRDMPTVSEPFDCLVNRGGICVNEPEVCSSNILQSSIETKPQLCQPSSVGVQVPSSVNKGPATSNPANGKREGIHVNNGEMQRKLTGDLKSLSMELKKGEPAFLISKRKDLCNIREGFNGDRGKNFSKLGTIPRRPDKEETTKGDSILLGGGMINKDHNNFGGKVNSASATDKATKSNTHKSVDSATVVSSTISTRNLKIRSSEGLKTGRGTTDLSSLKNSRNMGVSKDHFDATLKRETSSLRNLEKDTEVQGRTVSKNVHPVEIKTSITSLKRKTSEASNSNQVLLHPQKRLSLSPIENRNLKEPLESTVEVQCNQPENVTKTMLYNQPKSGLEIPNAKEDNIFLTMENDQNVEKAEEYAKELEDMCNMLKKKHEEAKELMVRAIVNNNRLLMLNHPMFDAKIQKVKKFAAQLVSS